jgi:hypothetical protein
MAVAAECVHAGSFDSLTYSVALSDLRGICEMPTISMFYGILVAMFFEDTDRHNLPHIHVRYAGQKASIAIEDGSVLAVAGEQPFRIAPLQ